MPTSTAMTASSGISSPSTSNTSAGCRRPWASARSRRDAFSARHRRPPGGDLCADRRAGRRPGSAASSSAMVRAMSPHSGTSTGWNLPRIIRSRSTWMVGTQVGIEVWLENDAPSTRRQSAWATVWLATGMPERPSTPQPSGWSSGKVPLALNVEITGASRCSASASTASRWGRAPLPHHDGRALGGARAARRRGPARRPAGRCAVAAIRPARGRGGGSARPGSSCTSSGSTRWATSRCTMACFMARAASSVALAGDRIVWLHSATASKAFSSGSSWNVPGPDAPGSAPAR